MNWFDRHLNWTYFLFGFLPLWTFTIVVGPAYLLPEGVYAGSEAFIGLIVFGLCIGIDVWVLRNKERSLWWIAALFVPIIGLFTPMLVGNEKDKRSRRSAIQHPAGVPVAPTAVHQQRAPNEQRTEAIDLRELRRGYCGKRYADLVKHHLERQDQGKRMQAFKEMVAMLPEDVIPLVEDFVDRQNANGCVQSFWQRDCAQVLDEILEDARTLVRSVDHRADDETLFNLFNIVTLNHAYSAAAQPEMRKFMGI